MSLRRFDGDEPAERHEHYDAEGNLTGVTVVTREPEWDERARTEALAAVYADWRRCPDCGLVDHSEDASLARDTRLWTWLDGRQIETSAYRCLGCAAIATARHRFEKRFEKYERTVGTYAPYDGVRWRAAAVHQTSERR